LGQSPAISGFDRALRLAGALAMTLALGGCGGGGGIEFEGKVFDYMGLSGDRQEADVRMTERPPLLLPPNAKRLPPPGQGAGMATARQDWPTDPELARKQAVAEKKAKVNAEAARNDPLNAYAGKPTLLDRWFGGSEDKTPPISDVPEPDPLDAPPQQDVATSTPRGLKPHVPEAPLPENAVNTPPPAPDSYSNPSQSRAY
jgi:hypothetical protein